VRSCSITTGRPNQLAGDYIARCLKVQRANDRRERQTGGHQRAGDSQTRGAEADAHAEREAEEARRAEREAEREARERATAFNAELGRGAYNSLSRVKVDERTLKILSSVNVTGELADLAMRGGRYGLPGWVEEATQRNGKTKYVYIDQRSEAERKAAEYLAGARTAGEIAGRQIALIAMAVYADQQAVAMSNRSWHHVTLKDPWAHEVGGLLDELITEKLSEATVALMAEMLGERKAHREEKLAEHEARQEATSRLEGVEERIPELGAEDVDRVTRISRRRGRAGRPATVSCASWSTRAVRRSRPSRPTRSPVAVRPGVHRGLRANRSIARRAGPAPPHFRAVQARGWSGNRPRSAARPRATRRTEPCPFTCCILRSPTGTPAITSGTRPILTCGSRSIAPVVAHALWRSSPRPGSRSRSRGRGRVTERWSAG